MGRVDRTPVTLCTDRFVTVDLPISISEIPHARLSQRKWGAPTINFTPFKNFAHVAHRVPNRARRSTVFEVRVPIVLCDPEVEERSFERRFESGLLVALRIGETTDIARNNHLG